jgi:hypothetical protein
MGTLCAFEPKAMTSNQGFRIIQAFTICVCDQMVRVMKMIFQKNLSNTFRLAAIQRPADRFDQIRFQRLRQTVDSSRKSRPDRQHNDLDMGWQVSSSEALQKKFHAAKRHFRTMNRSIQEKKVETGLADTSPGSLGETIEHWNTSYFAPLGLCAHLELSDSAMRKPNQKSSIIRKPSLLYREREERDRKREDRKFVVVVTELSHTSLSSTEVHEIAGDVQRLEMPVPDDPRCHIAELPGDSKLRPTELPNADDKAKEDMADVICGVSEVPGDIPVELRADIPEDDSLWPRSLAVGGSKTAQG